MTNDFHLSCSHAMALTLCSVIALMSCATAPAISAPLETERLIVRDVRGTMSSESFERFANKVDSTLTKDLQLWLSDARVKQFGKIIVEFDNSNPRAEYSFLFFRKENSQSVRVVRVSGDFEYPHQLAHKLTSAVFPNPDKLIRNMMGVASETRFGNLLSFPMCGFVTDYWVTALLQVGLYVPLAKMGPDHSDWGMEIVNNVPRATDRAKQHASYAEAGSFGEFLINTYSVEQMKRFNQISINKPRPWEEIFGFSLKELEAKWLEFLRLRSRGKEHEIATLVRLLRDNPNAACYSAQALTKQR